ncbi:MAG: DeoR/GlpR transcriptional regulator [Clostridiales bacterium]|nr:DeoR/GlpR transcriptional regulator [Clostridiales bacterium]
MIPFVRREYIISLLEDKKMLTVETLAKELFVSGATMRRDLQFLEKEGRIRRIHGGAALPLQSMQDMPLLSRRMERKAEKQAIAKAAARFISPGDTLILDASTTVLALGEALRDMGSLTIISSGLLTVQAFAVPGRRVMCTGGMLRENSASLAGVDAAAFLRDHHGSWSVVSCRGLTHDGLWESVPEEAAIKRCMLDAGDRHMLLCDSSKFNQYYLCKTDELRRIDVLVTDRQPQGTLLNALRQANVEIVLT